MALVPRELLVCVLLQKLSDKSTNHFWKLNNQKIKKKYFGIK